MSEDFSSPPRESKQHKFTPAERLALLEQWDQQIDHGAKSAWCRRMGISPTTAARWNRERREGTLLVEGQGANKYLLSKRERHELARLQRENEALKTRLAQSESAVEVLGKASELLTALAKSSHLHSPAPTPDPAPAPASGLGVPETFRGVKRDGSGSTPSPS